MSVETMDDLSVDETVADHIDRRICYPEVSDEVAAAVRELVDRIVVPTSSSGDDARFHIDNGDGDTRCNTPGFDGSSKPIECYPPGYRDWCVECVGKYRLDHGGIDDA